MNWWCSATDTAWSWTWRPYLGAYVVAGLLLLGYVRGWRREGSPPVRRVVAGTLGILVVLIAAEWPLAALGAGYVLSAQMVRQVLVVLVAVPLLLYAAPVGIGRWLDGTERRRRVRTALSRPVVAIVAANAILVLLNTPVVVEVMIGSQLGSFVVDAAWVVAGLLLWMPVQPPRPIEPRLVGPPAVAYLIVQSVAPLVPAFFMTWAEFPLFATFELAPRVWQGFDPLSDQQTAAAIMQGVGGLVMWVQIAARFIGWALREQRRDAEAVADTDVDRIAAAGGAPQR